MNFLEVKIYVLWFLTIKWVDFVNYLGSADNLIKLIPALVITGFTIYKWVILVRKRRKNKNIIE
jgi:hypothetical protein